MLIPLSEFGLRKLIQLLQNRPLHSKSPTWVGRLRTGAGSSGLNRYYRDLMGLESQRRDPLPNIEPTQDLPSTI